MYRSEEYSSAYAEKRLDEIVREVEREEKEKEINKALSSPEQLRQSMMNYLLKKKFKLK